MDTLAGYQVKQRLAISDVACEISQLRVHLPICPSGHPDPAAVLRAHPPTSVSPHRIGTRHPPGKQAPVGRFRPSSSAARTSKVALQLAGASFYIVPQAPVAHPSCTPITVPDILELFPNVAGPNVARKDS